MLWIVVARPRDRHRHRVPRPRRRSGPSTLTVVLAVWFVLSGLAKLVAAYQQRGRTDAGLVAINGVISLILGALIAAELPDSSDWAIGLLLGIMFLVDGAVMIALGWSLRRAEHDAVAPLRLRRRMNARAASTVA